MASRPLRYLPVNRGHPSPWPIPAVPTTTGGGGSCPPQVAGRPAAPVASPPPPQPPPTQQTRPAKGGAARSAPPVPVGPRGAGFHSLARLRPALSGASSLGQRCAPCHRPVQSVDVDSGAGNEHSDGRGGGFVAWGAHHQSACRALFLTQGHARLRPPRRTPHRSLL